MKVSTKGRYGLRAMIDIASQDENKRVTVKSIAKRQEISESYLEQIISVLRNAGLINSVRGSQGGYVLSRPVEEIIVGDIIRTLEGPIKVSDCLKEGECCHTCVAKNVWSKVQSSIEDVIDNITLKELVDDYQTGMKD